MLYLPSLRDDRTTRRCKRLSRSLLGICRSTEKKYRRILILRRRSFPIATMSQESRKESCDSADSMMGLSILSMAVLERSAATAERNETVAHPEGPQWRGIKTNDIHQKNGKQAISHRHIEKRRRDRINNTLWMLKDIVPAAKLKYASGSSRLEKADLLEMTVQHLKQVHKSLAQVPEKNGVESKGNNSAALNQVYCNGFTDGIVHILNELKKLNLLTQKQTEQFLMEDKERRKSAMFDFAGQTCKNVTEAVEGETVDAQGVTSVEELTKEAISDFSPQIRGNSTSTETRPKQPIQIKLEEDCLLSEDGISNEHPHRHGIKTETQDSSTHSIFENDIFLRHGSIPATNGQSNCPMLLPAYVLHASGTHYVPVLLPPSAVTPSSTKQI